MDNFKVTRPTVTGQRQTTDGFVIRGAQPRTVRPLSPRPPGRAAMVAPDLRPPQVKPTVSASPPAATRAHTKVSVPARSLPNLDLNIPATKKLSRRQARKQRAAAKPPSAGRTFRKWLLRGGLATMSLLVIVGGVLFAQGYMKLHKVFKGGASHAAALQKDVNPTLLKGEGDGRVNILLLGNGGDGHDGADLTDTMMVASIDPVNKGITLLSVPRDLWVKMPVNYFGTNQKINAAYESGKYKTLGKVDASNADTAAVDAGFAAADQAVTEVLGITIHYNMVINFTAFRQAVDTVGGITVNVPTQLYDPTMAWENHNSPILAQPGVQQMNGVQALLYARSRETTSDFARGERQRAIIVALKDKILTAGTLSNPLKISQLMSAFGDNMVTDISLSDAVRMYDLTKDITADNIKSLDLVTPPNQLITTANLNGTSIDEPKAGLDNYGDIQTFVRSNLKDGYITKENAQVTVLNGTTLAGLATTKANELKSYGYNVTKVDNAPTSTYQQTVIVDLTNGADKYTKHYLESRYGVTATTTIPDSTIPRGTADFIIILGQDQLQ